jgi:hypothetical protein
MDATELQLIQLSRQIGVVAQQAAGAYEQAQAALQLNQLFTLDSIATEAGTRHALDTVSRLSELHLMHQHMFAKFVTAAMEQLTTVIATLPVDRANEYQRGLIPSLNSTLANQAEFYSNRDRWIASVREMFTIVDQNRDVICIEDGQLMCYANDVADRYDAAQQIINDIHEYEVAHMQEKVARAAASSAYLAALEKSATQ